MMIPMFLRKEPLKRKELKPVDTAEVASTGTMSVSMHVLAISNRPD